MSGTQTKLINSENHYFCYQNLFYRTYKSNKKIKSSIINSMVTIFIYTNYFVNYVSLIESIHVRST